MGTVVLEQAIDTYLELPQEEKIKWSWSGLSDPQLLSAKQSYNLLDMRESDMPAMDVLRIMRTADYLFWAAKVLLHLDSIPFQALMLEELWKRAYPMVICSRGASKSFTMAIYALLKMRLVPGSKIVICGSSFRQSKVIFEYMETIWNKASVLRSTCDASRDGPKHQMDRWTFRIGDSVCTAVPIGNGDKIRGLRATTVIVDEFSSIVPEIYETVIAGFGAVKKDPIQGWKDTHKRQSMIQQGVWTAEQEDQYQIGQANQNILSGTCGYDFEHFAKYHRRYHSIIMSGGDQQELYQLFGKDYKGSLDYRDYSIVRLPFELIPDGFMDEKTVMRAKATMNNSSYEREYATIFSKDSDGFFKKTLIDSCTVDKAEIKIGDEKIDFAAVLKGDPRKKYVYGIDPASERDNLAVVVLELHPDHTRIVHCWTINRDLFKEKVKAGLIDKHDYFQYCVQKVRDLMKVFPCARIMMDAQGGGITLLEAFQQPPEGSGEMPIFEVTDPKKPKLTDTMHGLKIIEMCQNANSKWLVEANHGMKFDFENKLLLFPKFDSIEIALAYEKDHEKLAAATGKVDHSTASLYDGLESCVLEIEQLKEELTTIIHSKTPNGTERWDTPETRTGVGRKSRARKDRYSALMYANMGARAVIRQLVAPPVYSVAGVRVGQGKAGEIQGDAYAGHAGFNMNVDLFRGV